MKKTKFLLAATVVFLIVLVAMPNASAKPILNTPIDDVSIKEDETVVGKIKLEDHFLSDNGEIYYSSVRADNKMDVIIHEDSSVDFSAPKDWYGSEEVTFIASDGEQEASDTAIVTVTPVNDAPVLLTPMRHVDFLEDEALIDGINLNDHFQDIDSTLTFTHTSEIIGVHIDENGCVDFSAPKDWYGTEAVTFFASDGELEVSDEVMVTVDPVNDAPVTHVNVLSIGLNPDESAKILDLKGYFTDVDDPFLSYEISGNKRIKYKLDTQEGKLKLKAPQDWSGEEHITLTARDSSGETSSIQLVVVASKGMDYSGQMFYMLGLVLTITIAGARLQMVGRKRPVRSPVKLSSYRHYKEF